MNELLQSLIADLKALESRITNELGFSHHLFSEAGKAVSDAKAKLEAHPDAVAPAPIADAQAAPASPANAAHVAPAAPAAPEAAPADGVMTQPPATPAS